MKYVLCVLLSAFLVSSCHNAAKIDISFIQNGKRIEPINGIITLDKASFDIVFKTAYPFDILVNTSFNDSLYALAAHSKPLTLQAEFKENATIAEVLFNENNTIYLSKTSTSIWYYQDEQNHKFNTVEKQNGSLICTRTINTFDDIDTDTKIDVTNIDNTVNLVFLSVDKIEGSVSNLKELERLAVKIEWTDKSTISEGVKETISFSDMIKGIPIRGLPLKDTVNFDATMEEPYFYNKEDVKILQLEKIYPNYYKEHYNYRSMPSYKIKISEDYFSLVVMTYKEDHEMESVLINYTLDGQLIDYKVISHNEIAKDFTKVTSKIENKTISTTTVANNGENKQDRQHFQIDENGFINEVNLIDSALAFLNIDTIEVATNFLNLIEITDTKAIVFIPTMTQQAEGELFVNANLLIVNPKNGDIQSVFVEKKSWTSDAMEITNIDVSHNPYQISNNSETVGITVHYSGSSRVNPYESKQFTLFERRGDVLARVLKDYEIYNFGGENDGDGNGFYIKNVKSIMPQTDTKTIFYNLKITDSIKEVEYENDVNKNTTKSSYIEYLIYSDGTYKKDATD